MAPGYHHLKGLMVIDYIYDIETYPNMFCIGIKTAESGIRWRFEISDRVNQSADLLQLLNQFARINGRMVGFNNIGFDYPVIHLLMTTPNVTAKDLYDKAMSIINCDWNDRFNHTVWDNEIIIPQLDLFKIHHFDNVSRSTSLKQIEFALRMENIKDLPFPVGTILNDDQKNVLLDYMDHDIDATHLFYNETVKQIEFREKLSAQYNHNFMNHNDTKLGKDYFIMELEKKLPGSCYYQVNGRKEKRQTPRPEIHLKDAVFPYIKFRTPEFQRICDHFKGQTITQTKGVFDNLCCTVKGFEYVFGLGGIHGSVSAQTVSSDDDHVLIDLDVASYYPNIAIANRVYPAHLGDAFCDIYKDLYEQRKATDKKDPINAMLKLALNGVYGDSNSRYSPFYDPLYTMTITINGQLLLCMLAENILTISGVEIIQINTDGLTVKIHRSLVPLLESVARAWERFTCLELESVEYSHMYIRDVNNYIGEYYDGSLKRKGCYEHVHPRDRKPTGWHQNLSALVVAKAAEAALVDGEDIETFILDHDDPMDFMRFAKVPRNSILTLGGQQIQSKSRYYISTDGQELLKIMPPLPKQIAVNPDAPNRTFAMPGCKGWLVTECNDYSPPENINYQWYIEETKKIVNPLRAVK